MHPTQCLSNEIFQRIIECFNNLVSTHSMKQLANSEHGESAPFVELSLLPTGIYPVHCWENCCKISLITGKIKITETALRGIFLSFSSAYLYKLRIFSAVPQGEFCKSSRHGHWLRVAAAAVLAGRPLRAGSSCPVTGARSRAMEFWRTRIVWLLRGRHIVESGLKTGEYRSKIIGFDHWLDIFSVLMLFAAFKFSVAR